MASPTTRFDQLITELTAERGVTPPGAGRGFGSTALRFRKKIFAMLADNQLVVKLPRDRVAALVATGHGKHFDANKGTPMKEWLRLDPGSQLSWPKLTREALDFVKSSQQNRPK